MKSKKEKPSFTVHNTVDFIHLEVTSSRYPPGPPALLPLLQHDFSEASLCL